MNPVFPYFKINAGVHLDHVIAAVADIHAPYPATIARSNFDAGTTATKQIDLHVFEADAGNAIRIIRADYRAPRREISEKRVAHGDRRSGYRGDDVGLHHAAAVTRAPGPKKRDDGRVVGAANFDHCP